MCSEGLMVVKKIRDILNALPLYGRFLTEFSKGGR
jgi:hypothetical protein